jgi:hypothetical protein
MSPSSRDGHCCSRVISDAPECRISRRATAVSSVVSSRSVTAMRAEQLLGSEAGERAQARGG